ncbi:hypothetical protein OHS18_21260 [Amycolatopsis sp. NBC_00355]|uniref:hypothetical protein n=1 Tax=Amycolatopsis sp. NBC_00355 TaxID=2975957 RepID=UPI002E25B41A
MWLVSGALRLFLVTAAPAAVHVPLLVGLVAAVVTFVVPAPRSTSWANAGRLTGSDHLFA